MLGEKNIIISRGWGIISTDMMRPVVGQQQLDDNICGLRGLGILLRQRVLCELGDACFNGGIHDVIL